MAALADKNPLFVTESVGLMARQFIKEAVNDLHKGIEQLDLSKPPSAYSSYNAYAQHPAIVSRISGFFIHLELFATMIGFLTMHEARATVQETLENIRPILCVLGFSESIKTVESLQSVFKATEWESAEARQFVQEAFSQIDLY
jgi:hypothetical protein